MADQLGVTVLHLAAEFGTVSLINQIYNHLPDGTFVKLLLMRDKSGQMPLFNAVRNSRGEDTSRNVLLNLIKLTKDACETDTKGNWTNSQKMYVLGVFTGLSHCPTQIE